LGYKIHIYGYGNPGREDDGLGNALVERMQSRVDNQFIHDFEFDSNYQLNIEDAANIADKDLVIFADASTENIIDYEITPVDATAKITFTSHAASPGYIVGLCKELYGKTPAVYLLHIKGYQWEFKEGLSEKAIENLNAAVEELMLKLRHPETLIKMYDTVN